MEVLSKRDLDNLERILQLSNSIGKLYDNLSELEKKGHKNSPIYQKNLEYLKIAIEVEDGIYPRILNDHKMLKNISTYLDEHYKLSDCDPYFDYLCLNREEKSALRIRETIYNRLGSSLSNYSVEYEEDINTAAYLYDLVSALNKDILFNFLLNNDREASSSIANDDLKDRNDLLIDFKYNVSYVNKNLEKDFINKRFIVEQLNDLDPRVNAVDLKLSYREYKLERDYYLMELLYEKIGNYDIFNEFDLLISFNAKKRELIYNYIVSSIDMLGNKSIIELNKFLEEIEYEEFLKITNKKLNSRGKVYTKKRKN